jgi:hypothetical protein
MLKGDCGYRFIFGDLLERPFLLPAVRSFVLVHLNSFLLRVASGNLGFWHPFKIRDLLDFLGFDFHASHATKYNKTPCSTAFSCQGWARFQTGNVCSRRTTRADGVTSPTPERDTQGFGCFTQLQTMIAWL